MDSHTVTNNNGHTVSVDKIKKNNSGQENGRLKKINKRKN